MVPIGQENPLRPSANLVVGLLLTFVAVAFNPSEAPAAGTGLIFVSNEKTNTARPCT